MRAIRCVLMLLLLGAMPAWATTYRVGIGDDCPSGVNVCFSPTPLTISVGDSVSFYDYADTHFTGPHNVVADDGSFRCANGCDDDGGNGAPVSDSTCMNGVCVHCCEWTAIRTFTVPGVVPYHDEVSRATGVIIVQGATGIVPGFTIDLDQNGLTGSWYDPQISGQGFEVEVYPDLLSPGTGLAFVAWFTYDSVVGGAERQRWYTLSGPVVSGQPNASLTIYQNTNGNFNAPPITKSIPVGTATLGFDSCISGQLSYTFTDGSGRSGTIPLQRLMQNVSCSPLGVAGVNYDFILSGSWYDPATAGQGITVEVNPVSNVLFFAWETYAPNGANAGPAGQRWYTGQGAFAPENPQSITVPLYESTGGMFNALPPIPSTVAVGSATLAFQSCTDATLSYSFTGGSNSGASGTILLVRDFVPYGVTDPDCVGFGY